MNIFANIYEGSTAALVLHRKSEKLPIKKGVRQGDTISTATHCMLRRSLEVRINGEYYGNLRFADDIVLFSNNGDELQQMIKDLDREIRVGLIKLDV